MIRMLKNDIAVLLLILIQNQQNKLQSLYVDKKPKSAYYRIRIGKLYQLLMEAHPLKYRYEDKYSLSFDQFKKVLFGCDYISQYHLSRKRNKRVRIIKSKIKANVW